MYINKKYFFLLLLSALLRCQPCKSAMQILEAWDENDKLIHDNTDIIHIHYPSQVEGRACMAAHSVDKNAYNICSNIDLISYIYQKLHFTAFTLKNENNEYLFHGAIDFSIRKNRIIHVIPK